MNRYTVWKTVAIRLGLLLALKRIQDKTGDDEDTPTRVVDRLVRGHVVKRAKELKIEIDDVVATGEEQ